VSRALVLQRERSAGRRDGVRGENSLPTFVRVSPGDVLMPLFADSQVQVVPIRPASTAGENPEPAVPWVIFRIAGGPRTASRVRPSIS